MVYVGGHVSKVTGTPRIRIAAVDASTAALMAWNPNADGPPNALLVEGSTVYAGGSFANIGGKARKDFAALDATSGLALDGWDPGPDCFVSTLVMSGTTIYAGGCFSMIGGVRQSHFAAIADVTVDVPTHPVGAPAGWRLENQPNPFRHTTRITFVVPTETRVTLEVFDPAGRLVSTLLRDERATAGPHHADFRTAGLPSGVYLSRLRTDRYAITRKMTVLE